MKRNNLRLPNLFLLLFFLITCAQSLHAQQVFKVGDRVMVSPSSLKDEKYWRPGTVTEVHNFTPKKAYSVTCDPLSATDHPSSFLVNEDWVKPLITEKPPAPANNKTQPVNNQPQPKAVTQNANNKVACPPSDPDSKGATAFERSIRGAIRADFEKTPQLNEDGKVTVSFQNVNIGQSHAWQQLHDPIDAKGKTIYEVRSTFTTCTDYFHRIEYMQRERAFACYKNNADQWVCEVVAATNTNIKDQIKSIDKTNK
jgi:hypothetical protein